MNISEHIKDYRICSIVGSTATGKTALALKTAQELLTTKKASRVHLLSADSRQVYKGLENLTGADIPEQFIATKDSKLPYNFWQNPKQNIFLHGVSIINTQEEWSAAHFKKLFLALSKSMKVSDFLIVVGGTGFYQQQISNPADTLNIPPNLELRLSLEKMSLDQLQKKLQVLDQSKLQSLNHSDLNNPRRLMRAIEIAVFLQKQKSSLEKNEASHKLPIFYLQLEKVAREEKIKRRVEERFALAKKEVAEQLRQGKFNKAVASCTGFQELRQLLAGEVDQKTCLALWQKSEIQYAKRQDTWWKKRTDLCYI